MCMTVDAHDNGARSHTRHTIRTPHSAHSHTPVRHLYFTYSALLAACSGSTGGVVDTTSTVGYFGVKSTKVRIRFRGQMGTTPAKVAHRPSCGRPKRLQKQSRWYEYPPVRPWSTGDIHTNWLATKGVFPLKEADFLIIYSLLSISVLSFSMRRSPVRPRILHIVGKGVKSAKFPPTHYV